MLAGLGSSSSSWFGRGGLLQSNLPVLWLGPEANVLMAIADVKLIVVPDEAAFFDVLKDFGELLLWNKHIFI